MSPRPAPPGRMRRGITLMETMLAIGIVLMMSAIGWASVQDAIEMNDALAQGDATTRAARVALGRLRRELQVAYLTPNRGSALTYRTVFVAEDSNPDEIWFASLSHQRRYRNSRECDQTEITVWTERADREQGPGDILYHREAPRIDENPDQDGIIWPLAYNVRTFNLRFLDGRLNEWKDEWNSDGADTPYMLPRAVEVGLVLLGPDPDDERRTVDVPFLTTVPLFYADPIVPLLGSGLQQGQGQAGQGQAGQQGMSPAIQRAMQGGFGGGARSGGGGGNR